MSEVSITKPRGTVAEWWRMARQNAGRALELVAPYLPAHEQRNQSVLVVDGFSVRCATAVPNDPQFHADWTDLFNRTPAATTFQHPSWQRALMETPQALRRLRFFTIYQEEKLVGVVPLETRFNQTLRCCGAALTDYLNPLIDPLVEQLVWPALLRGVRALEPGRTLVMENIDASAGLSDMLPQRMASLGCDLSSERVSATSRIALPSSWDDYLQSLAGHDRKELRRKMRKAEEQGGARLVACKHPVTLPAELAAVFQLMQGFGGGKARKAKWLFPRHFQSITPELAKSGRLVLYKLIIEDSFAAAVIAMPSRQGPILWNTAFEPTMRPWSPGIVLFGMLVRQSIEQGCTSVDLLRGQYDYKHRLGAVDHPLYALTLSGAAGALNSAA